jgi:hypothetical protein
MTHLRQICPALVVIVALSTTGCFSDPVAEIQAHAFREGVTLNKAYESLLDNSSWEKVRVDGTTYVEVKGIIKGSSDTLMVRYEAKPRPPVVTVFEVNGGSREVGEFAKFLYDLHLKRAIMQQGPAS